MSTQRKKKQSTDTSTVYSQINKYIRGKHSLPASEGQPIGPSVAGGAWEDRPGWRQALALRSVYASITGAPSLERESREGPF